MGRTLAAMLACLTVGAGGMWVASNFRVKFEPVGGPVVSPTPQTPPPADKPEPPPPVAVASAPPEKLPVHLLPPPKTDAGVRQAGGSLPAMTVGAATLGLGEPVVPTEDVIQIRDGTDVIWDKPTGVVRLANNKPSVILTQDKFNSFKIKYGNSKREETVTPTPANQQVEVSLNLSQEGTPGQEVTVTITRIDGASKAVKQATVRVIRPHPASGAAARFFVDRVATTDGLAAEEPAAKVEVYGTYLRVRGRAFGSFQEPKFFYTVGGRTLEVAQVQSVAPLTPAGDWEYRLTLPALNSATEFKLLTRGDFTDGHAFVDTALTVRVNLLPAPLAAPQVAIQKSASEAEPLAAEEFQAAGLPTYLLNRRAVKVRVTPSGAGAQAVALYLDDRLIGTEKIPAATPKQIDFDIPAVGDGRDHVLKAVGKVADSSSPSAQVAVKVVTTRPAVESVLAPGFGQTNGVGSEKVRIRFTADNRLDKALVVSGNFDVLHNERGDAPVSVRAGSPEFEPATNTVILTASPVKPGSYTVRVSKSVKDVYGNDVLVLPGLKSDTAAYETVLYTATVDTPQPSQTAGVTLQTGPNVTFPEYTKYREVPDGFNPSDRVETRVVRLYYTRDAHRVAQIINRDVKSYNVAAVDVRRRAADRARDDANLTQDERQRLERAAVTAAGATRAAEAKLRDLQSRLATARNEAAVATTQIGQRQGQLDQFQRTFGRDQANVGVRRDTDVSTDEAQRRVDRLRADIARLETVATAATTPGITATSRPTDLDTPILNARGNLSASQQALTVAYSTAKADVEKKDPAVIGAINKVAKLETDRQQPNLTPDQLARLDSELALARQERDVETQNAILRSTYAADLQSKTQAVQTNQLTFERLVNAREALAVLPAQRQALLDAERDLTRARAVAQGRSATDTGADLSQDTVTGLQAEIRKLNSIVASSTAAEQSLRDEITRATADVQARRTEEVRANELALSKDREELRKREEQFRREVAAAKADPDTYAPGKPKSDDPVEQCSISVIGEGLIQIRGPVKGLNVIRTMINQMDAPTGQVRVGVHTVQVNGERQERMDKVVANIQRYLDHSRFLTTQSAQMLRKAVTLVASRKADEAAHTLAPGCSRAEQDLKYLHCFFGKDFIEELRQLDSEFLRTGNKLLSLHSMDSTSLSAALFLLALAKNDIRAEILQEWQGQLQTKLPAAEMAFYTAGLACPDKCEAHCDKKFCVLAQNAKFASFHGFFDAEVQGNDTLTPVQREFVRLAQIFKTRLVTELELKQRVMERTLLEDRLGNYIQESREAKDREDDAKRALLVVQASLQDGIVKVSTAFGDLEGEFKDVDDEFSRNQKAFTEIVTELKKQEVSATLRDQSKAPPTITYRGEKRALPRVTTVNTKDGDVNGIDFSGPDRQWVASVMLNTAAYMNQFYYLSESNYKRYKEAEDNLEKFAKAKKMTQKEFEDLVGDVRDVFELIRGQMADARRTIGSISGELRKPQPDVVQVLTTYTRFRDDVLAKLRDGSRIEKSAQVLFNDRLGPAFRKLEEAVTKQQAALRQAQLARRPLDEKKLLDMLVDEMEDKYIELLDGTRAHTANVDNYLKALATALDDDFQTQFYAPAFRKIRTLGTSWDVQLGQIESTTVLTNNRVLGKVSPAASMEFDLPRRDILMKEAFRGAKAAIQDYGALLNDPVFLSMVKMYGGMPPSAQFGGAGGGLPAVRNVLPGLPSSADEMILAQGGSPRKEFGTNLEALIADPAIYKFETGTGYEIRPVISPDGQAVVFGFDYMYTTDLREPVRADEKHLGRVKRHFVHTDVQLSNFELREVSKYWVALKAARTGQGVQLLQDIPGVGALFRPAPSAQSSLQQNLIYSQAAIFPTLFDLMGLRYAPAVADIDPDFTKNDEFVVRGRRDYLRQFIFDYGASRVDDALRILYGERRPDLYRSQHTIPWVHPNGYQGPGLRQRDSYLQEEYNPLKAYPKTEFAPGMHTPLPADRNGRFDDPLGYPPTLPGSGHAPPVYLPPGGLGAKSNGQPVREYGAKPLGTTVTREPPPAGYTPLKAAAPTAPPPSPSRPGQPTVQAPGGRSAPLPTIPPPPVKADPLEVEPAPISTGQRGNPYQRR